MPPITLYNSHARIKGEHAEAVAKEAREDPTRRMWQTVLQNWIDTSEIGCRFDLGLKGETHPHNEKHTDEKGNRRRSQHRTDFMIVGTRRDNGLSLPIVVVECKKHDARQSRLYQDVVTQLKERLKDVATVYAGHDILGLAIVGEDIRMFLQRGESKCWDPLQELPDFKLQGKRDTFISMRKEGSQLVWRALENTIAKCAEKLAPRPQPRMLKIEDMVETAHTQMKYSPDPSPSPGPSNPALPPSQAQQQRSHAASSSRKPQEVQLAVAPRKQQKDRKAAASSGKFSFFGRGSKTANERNSAQQSKASSSSYTQPQQRSTAASSSHEAAQQRPTTSSASRYLPQQQSFTSNTSHNLVQQRPTTSGASHYPPQQQSFVSSTSHYPPQQRPTTSSQAYYQSVQQQPANNSSRYGKQKLVEVTPTAHYHSTQQQRQQQQLNSSSSRQGIQYQQVNPSSVPTASEASRSDVQHYCRGYFRYLMKHMTQQTAEEYIVREAAALRRAYGGSMQQAYAHIDKGDYAEMLVTALRTNRI